MTFQSWRKESPCTDNLPKTIFPSLLYKLFPCLTPKNLVSGVRATSIVPLERIKFQIEPGRQVGANDFLSDDKENEKPTSSKQKAKESFRKS